MPRDESFYDWFADRRGIIHVADSKKARAWIVSARLIPRRRKLYEGVMLANRDRLGRRRHMSHPLPGIVAGKRESGFYFRIQRKILCLRKIDRAARGIQMVGALLRPAERRWNGMRVAQKKFGGIHEGVILLLRCHGKTPERGLRKRIMHRALFVEIVTYGP